MVGVHVAVSHFAVSHIAVSHFAVPVRFLTYLFTARSCDVIRYVKVKLSK